MKTSKNRQARLTGGDIDAALAAAAQGEAPTSDDAAALDGEDRRETDVIGKAAGVAVANGKPLGGPDEIEQRDAHRWELDPASADEVATVQEDTSSKSPAPRMRRHRSSGER
ncbi:MAG: DUF6335 family protein [Kofleriaceae bacterium]